MAKNNEIQEKEIWHVGGFIALGWFLLIAAAVFVFGIMIVPWLVLSFPLWVVALIFLFKGFTVIQPNEAAVFTFFGKYHGSLKRDGFYFVNPLTGCRKISLKTLTLQNNKQKINDELGNPIEVGIVVIWRIIDTAQAVFNVDSYYNYLSIQSDSSLRRIVSQYPYDTPLADKAEKSLRGSSQEISDKIKAEIQKKVEVAGIEIIDAKITHLAYAPEIALAMLQRQQAAAVIDARKLIVEGAVGMVDMAIKKLAKNNVVKLSEDRKAHMVSNLLVVLCGNKDAQPVVNSGSITEV